MLKTKVFKSKYIKSAVWGLALVAGSASAFELKFDNSDMTGYIDTTVSASVAMSTKNVQPLNAGPSGRGSIFDGSGDVYSAPLSFITDAGVSWGDVGVFSRFGYLYDFEMMDGANKCTNCSGRTSAGTLDGIPEGARNEYNQFTLYDLFVYGSWELDGHFTTLRIGKQVVSWGESNIMSGGINQMQNPADFAKTTTPGTEVKERLLPQEMVLMAYDFTENTSMEAYYVWNWRRSQFLPVGSMFSPFDFLGQGFNPDLNVPGVEKRGSDKPSNGGQWGISLHHILEDYNDMDFGMYWVRSHAFQPFLQANYDPSSLTGMSYHEVFSEDQDTYALSLNGEVGDTGISFQSEVNMKADFWDTRQCQNFFGLAGILAAGEILPSPPFDASMTPVYPDTGGVPGCENESNDVYTWLGNLTYSAGGGPFGVDKQSYLLDWVGVWVDDLEQGDPSDKSDARLGLDAPGVDQLDRFVTDFSWGYTIVAAYEYNNVFWAVNVKPSFVWVHNVEGYTPFNNTALVENQRTVKVGVTFDYQSQMSLELAATWWPGKEGTWSDRDNVSAIFKYSF